MTASGILSLALCASANRIPHTGILSRRLSCCPAPATCPWRIPKIMRRLESDTTLRSPDRVVKDAPASICCKVEATYRGGGWQKAEVTDANETTGQHVLTHPQSAPILTSLV